MFLPSSLIGVLLILLLGQQVRQVRCGLMGDGRKHRKSGCENVCGSDAPQGEMKAVDFYGMLEFIDRRLQPAKEQYNYHNRVPPLELVLGYSGCYSSFVKQFRKTAEEKGISIYQLITQVSEFNKKILRQA